jgi:hypothetical protein
VEKNNLPIESISFENPKREKKKFFCKKFLFSLFSGLSKNAAIPVLENFRIRMLSMGRIERIFSVEKRALEWKISFQSFPSKAS